MTRTRASAVLLVVAFAVAVAAFGEGRARAQGPETGATAAPAAKGQGKAKGKGKARVRREADGFYQGRRIAEVMSFQGAEWLVRASREQEEQPDRMLDALQIAKGATVADVGAGVGYTSLKIAERVGPKGKVLATDLQPEMLAMLAENVARAGVTNVEGVRCTPTDPKLPAGAVDLVLMVDVYHECSDPEATLQGVYKALKPKGRLVLVEFRGEDPDVPIKPEHKMTVKQVRKELEPQGFTFRESLEFLPWQHVLIFEKGRAPEGGGGKP